MIDCKNREVTVSDNATARQALNETLSSLIRLSAGGNRRAFEQIYTLASPRLYALCLQILGREDAAQDVLQESFVSIWRSAGDFDGRRAAPMTWMSAIVRNRAIDVLRSPSHGRERAERLDEEEGFASADPGPLDDVLRWADAAALRLCIAGLEPAQRNAITLAFFKGLSHGQLAHAVGAPVGTVKSWVRRGMRALRTCLESSPA